ncbi:MAG TPA: YdeI/OmpD-associated family protein [Terriglobales bacterium]|nr:YdeI/OmpD-associated family protein [Terriglobales bacterium]
MTTVFFRSSDEFRHWLAKNHDSEKELVVGFYKKESGRPSITYPEARDQALCFGWIDGVRRNIDEVSYCIRFTPRKAKSIWSAVNIARVKELTKLGQMVPEGLKVFETRHEDLTRRYSFENKPTKFEPPDEKIFRAKAKAWEFFQSQPPGYRRTAMFWMMSAKREETRRKRLEELISDSGKGLRIRVLRRGE